uniref:RNase H type-1 domain-containing protein n=1 Tax=Cannabis sativa TaxID=3483 RepID=A0A803PJ45_CANSA
MALCFFSSGLDTGLEHYTELGLNKIKVNVDGALFLSKGWLGVGGVARDCGQLLKAFSMSKSGCVDAAIVEIVSIKETLSWIKRKGWMDVQLENDCLVAIQALHSSIYMPSPFGLLV